VLAIYRREVEPDLARPDLVVYSVKSLVAFWGDDFVSAIKGPKCRDYVKWRCTKGVSQTTARHDLKTLRAAINHYHRGEYGLKTVPVVTLPPRAEPRMRWLSRQEAARLLKAAKGCQHLRRFILIGLYTGTRSQATLGLSWIASTSSGYVDLRGGVLYRRGQEQRLTKKQTPARLPSRLLAHLRRWQRVDAQFGVRFICHYQGSRVQKLRRSWDTARKAAGLGEDVVPHVLRHTAATWVMQGGCDMWEAAGYFGMTVETLEEVYGHHHPDHQKGVENALGRSQAVTRNTRTQTELTSVKRAEGR
jgi:integrase